MRGSGGSGSGSFFGVCNEVRGLSFGGETKQSKDWLGERMKKITSVWVGGEVRLHLVTVWHDHLCQGVGALVLYECGMWGDERGWRWREGLCEGW